MKNKEKLDKILRIVGKVSVCLLLGCLLVGVFKVCSHAAYYEDDINPYYDFNDGALYVPTGFKLWVPSSVLPQVSNYEDLIGYKIAWFGEAQVSIIEYDDNAGGYMYHNYYFYSNNVDYPLELRIGDMYFIRDHNNTDGYLISFELFDVENNTSFVDFTPFRFSSGYSYSFDGDCLIYFGMSDNFFHRDMNDSFSMYLINMMMLNGEQVYSDLYHQGYQNGQQDANWEASREYRETWYNAGYTNGYNDAINSDPHGFYDLINAVFTVPVSVITGLFDFDIMGVNMLHVVLSLFTMACVVTIVLLILRFIK